VAATDEQLLPRYEARLRETKDFWLELPEGEAALARLREVCAARESVLDASRDEHKGG